VLITHSILSLRLKKKNKKKKRRKKINSRQQEFILSLTSLSYLLLVLLLNDITEVGKAKRLINHVHVDKEVRNRAAHIKLHGEGDGGLGIISIGGEDVATADALATDDALGDGLVILLGGLTPDDDGLIVEALDGEVDDEVTSAGGPLGSGLHVDDLVAVVGVTDLVRLLDNLIPRSTLGSIHSKLEALLDRSLDGDDTTRNVERLTLNRAGVDLHAIGLLGKLPLILLTAEFTEFLNCSVDICHFFLFSS